ncbi:hypothetical protein NP493_1286g00008 [Ridgeia piscesae]|uniref:Uncharacterized protein n=1 Tax=Ridgeia piscesae TaxID=27915 RepID=A0AAD9NG92_RIDPI|nr:hypothetical protein NP493_1286g00008 [Ridgeia piscesae]
MLTPARNSKELRSTSSNPLYIPRVKSEGNIVSFRRRLKTYLFNAAYPP